MVFLKILAVVAATVTLLVVVKMIRVRLSRFYVLEALIGSEDDEVYNVVFRKIHPDMQPVEFVWLCLLLAAKLLYVMGNDAKQADAKRLLLATIALVAHTPLATTDDLLGQLKGDLKVDTTVPSSRARVIKARIAYVDVATRTIWTSLPFVQFVLQYPCAWLATVQASLPHLNETLRDRLQGALLRMDQLYREEGWDPATLRSLQYVPTMAFNEAKVVVGGEAADTD